MISPGGDQRSRAESVEKSSSVCVDGESGGLICSKRPRSLSPRSDSMPAKMWRPVKKSTSQKILTAEEKDKAIDLSNKDSNKFNGR